VIVPLSMKLKTATHLPNVGGIPTTRVNFNFYPEFKSYQTLKSSNYISEDPAILQTVKPQGRSTLLLF